MFGKSKSKKAAKEVASSYNHSTNYNSQPAYYEPEPVVQADPEVVSKELVMAAQGAALDNHNKELVNRVTELKQKRGELDNQIYEEEAEKAKFEEHLIAIENKLQEVIQNLNRKIDMRNEYDAVIQETEAAYSRLLESSRSLLTVLERETLNIHKERRNASEAVEAMVLM